MKRRLFFFFLTVLSLVVLVGVWRASGSRAEPSFSGTANRACAPWDGAAFTVQVPLHGGDALDISIWQAPDIAFRKTFEFPDDSGQVGNALLIHPTGLPEALTGEVWFANVGVERPLEGGFRLTSERGEVFSGRFRAEWESKIVLCG